MDAIMGRLGRIDISGWATRNRARIAGLLAGSLGTIVVTLFLVVAITGNPYGRPDPTPPQVYVIE